MALRGGYVTVLTWHPAARALRTRDRARPLPVTAHFGHPLLENRFPQHLFGTLSLGKLPIKLPALRSILVRFLDKSKIWLELRVEVASAYHSFLRLIRAVGRAGDKSNFARLA